VVSETRPIPDLQTVDIDGPIAYRGWDGPPGTTFVMVHGLGGSNLSWLQVGSGLAGQGRVLAPDLPGFGWSPRAGRHSGLMDLRRSLSAFITAQATGRVILCGNSMGGALALLQAAVEPGSVDGIVLSGSVFPWARGGGLPHPLVLATFALYDSPGFGERFVSARSTSIDPVRAVRLSFRIIAAHAGTIPEDIVERHIDLARERQTDPDAVPAFLEAARSMIRLGKRPGVVARALDGVASPVLVLHGRRDRLVPVAFAEAELRRRPDWRGRIFPDLGHVPQMEAPGRWIAEVADWHAGLCRER
jgi:pimeloyl-ACP methyl ester carboxylesterase